MCVYIYEYVDAHSLPCLCQLQVSDLQSPNRVPACPCLSITFASCAGLRDTSSSISVTATLENAQRIVSKIPATAANEEDIAPLLQEFEELTAQLQAELDKLSAVTKNISPSSL